MDLLSNLMSAGFTEYEARVYLALLNEHPATGYQVSKKAGIPRSMVYEALGRLHARGAVLKADDRRSTLYRPVSPELLIDRFEHEQHTLIKNLRDGLSALFNPQNEDRLWSINGRAAIMAYAQQMILNAHSEILLVLADPDILGLCDEIRQACQRGVSVSALLTGERDLDCLFPKNNAKPLNCQVARHPPLESELQALTHMLLVAVDAKECLIASTEARFPEANSSPATITNNRNIVLIARQFVWMELFTQRIYSHLEPATLSQLAPEDRQILSLWDDKDFHDQEPAL